MPGEHPLVVDRHPLRLDLGGDDRQHRRPLPLERDRLLDLVAEEFAEIAAGRRRLHGRNARDGAPPGRAAPLRTDRVDRDRPVGRHRRRRGGRPLGLLPPGEAATIRPVVKVPTRQGELLVGIRHGLAVDLRPQRRIELGLHEGPRHVERLVEVHHKRDRPAADQRHPHVSPVGVGRVFHDRPALEPGLRRRRIAIEHEPVARLPDRRLLHVADDHVPRPLAREGDGHPLLLVIGGQCEHGQGLLELTLEPGIDELDPRDRIERERPQPFGGEQREELLLDRLVFAGLQPPLLNTHDRARHRRGGVEFHLLAAEPAEEVAERRVVGEVDGERAEGLRDRVAGGVGDGRSPAIAIEHDHALEQVVDIVGRELHLDGGIAGHLARVLEVAHARREQDHRLQRQRGVGGEPADGRGQSQGEGEGKQAERCSDDGHGKSPRQDGHIRTWVAAAGRICRAGTAEASHRVVPGANAGRRGPGGV